MRYFYVILLLLIFSFIYCGCSSNTEIISVYSSKMNKNIDNIIILPPGYDASDNKRYPVVYLLHGHNGYYKTIVEEIKKDIPKDAAKWDFIIVCPDGQNSWYWDSPVKKESQFETYISKELVDYVDEHYNTITSPKGRAISGFSMGGHGGLWLGINHPDVFGAFGSISGGVDLRSFPENWDIESLLGSYRENPQIWDEHTIINQLYKIKSKDTDIIISCGYDDFFYQVNEELHKEMVKENIRHEYIVGPGSHSNAYWSMAIDEQLAFFSKFFDKNKSVK